MHFYLFLATLNICIFFGIMPNLFFGVKILNLEQGKDTTMTVIIQLREQIFICSASLILLKGKGKKKVKKQPREL